MPHTGVSYIQIRKFLGNEFMLFLAVKAVNVVLYDAVDPGLYMSVAVISLTEFY